MDYLARLQQKIVTIEQFQAQKQPNIKVVFTNGCFDVLHLGHISYLAQARQLGDLLIVGINSDLSVKRLKGAHRPINPEYARAQLLAALFFVDAVIIFEEETPLRLINSLQPDILVKGADYAIENIVGAKETLSRGGKVYTIDLLAGYSSTNIIEKI